MNIIFQISGGMGKCIMATAVCSAIKKQYPKSNLIVVSAYPDVFLGNPNVFKAIGFDNTSYFYRDYILDQEVKIFAHDPYLTEKYAQEKEHLIFIWCEMNGIRYNGEMPELYLTKREKDFYQNQFNVKKPIFMLQTNGGADQKKYSWARDIPSVIARDIVKEFKKDYAIVHVRRDNQIAYPDTIQLGGNLRQMLSISLISKKRLLIDSFMQHAMAAFNLPSTVCWVGTNSKVLGYDIHNNISSNPFTIAPELKYSYLSKFNINGNEIEFPYNDESEIFSIENIISAIQEQK